MLSRVVYLLFLITIQSFFWSCSGQEQLRTHPADDHKSEAVTVEPSRTLVSAIDASDREVAGYFMEVAMGSEYGLGNFAVRKWDTDVRFEVVGQPTSRDLEVLQEVISELNHLIGDHVTLSIVQSDGNVKIHFIPHDEFHFYEPSGIIFYGGFFWTWWNATGEIHSGRIVIGADRINQHLRSHLIREEVTQVLGLMNDSRKYPDSIFYQDFSTVQEFSGLDLQIIKLLYDSEIRAGMLDFQVEELLRNRLSASK